LELLADRMVFIGAHGAERVTTPRPTAGRVDARRRRVRRRRRVLHFNVTEQPNRCLDGPADRRRLPGRLRPVTSSAIATRVYGHVFRQRLKGMDVGEVLTAPDSPWQNPFAERLIGSIRRACLNHVLVLGERHLRRILTHCRVEGWRGTPCARLQPPPDRTARTVFPYAALLPASRQGL